MTREELEKATLEYKSPIHIEFADFVMKIVEDFTVQAVQNVDIQVDKEELLKALKYDRGQYEKGYRQGWADAMEPLPVKRGKWIERTFWRECSICGSHQLALDFNFCPNCGEEWRVNDGLGIYREI